MSGGCLLLSRGSRLLYGWTSSFEEKNGFLLQFEPSDIADRLRQLYDPQVRKALSQKSLEVAQLWRFDRHLCELPYIARFCEPEAVQPVQRA